MGVDASAQARYRRHLSPWPVWKVTRPRPPRRRLRSGAVASRASCRSAFAEPSRRRCHFSLSGGEAGSGDRAAAEDDRRAGGEGEGSGSGSWQPPPLSPVYLHLKARWLDQENSRRSPSSAFVAVRSVVLFVFSFKSPIGAPGRLLACGNGRLVSGPQKQMPGVAD